jgi:hypothetical protein
VLTFVLDSMGKMNHVDQRHAAATVIFVVIYYECSLLYIDPAANTVDGTLKYFYCRSAIAQRHANAPIPVPSSPRGKDYLRTRDKPSRRWIICWLRCDHTSPRPYATSAVDHLPLVNVTMAGGLLSACSAKWEQKKEGDGGGNGKRR